MPLTIPPAVNFQSPLVAVPSGVLNSPREGNRQISCEVDWATMGGAKNCVNVNFSNNATLDFSQIVALKVDNSQCGSDVVFIFPDTGDTVAIPAGTPYALVPVFTHGQQFFVKNLNEEADDITRFQILNFLPPPVTVGIATAQDGVSPAPLAMVAGVGNVLVNNTVFGTVQSLTVQKALLAPAAAYLMNLNIKDGLGNIIAKCTAAGPASPGDGIILNLSNINIRFGQGIFADIVGGSPPGGTDCYFLVNLAYRTP